MRNQNLANVASQTSLAYTPLRVGSAICWKSPQELILVRVPLHFPYHLRYRLLKLPLLVFSIPCLSLAPMPSYWLVEKLWEMQWSYSRPKADWARWCCPMLWGPDHPTSSYLERLLWSHLLLDGWFAVSEQHISRNVKMGQKLNSFDKGSALWPCFVPYLLLPSWI